MDTTNQEELEQLIAQQKHDMLYGYRVSRPHTISHYEGDGLDWLLMQKPHRRMLRQPLSPHDIRHGTLAGHRTNCKCANCRKAGALYKRAMRQLHKKRGLALDDPRHGTLNSYSNLGCRCKHCKAANAKYQRDYQANRKKKNVHDKV